MEKKRVLFVCTHNSARSQMAEGMLRAWGGDKFEPFSAGTDPGEIRPEAITVMDEIAIDIRGQRSKGLDEFAGQEFEWLITVCDRARTECSNIPGVANPAHWGIEDPSAGEGTDEERLAVFREVRDDIRNRMHIFILAASRDDVPRPTPTAVQG
ncbi:MAG: arsenate reductase ArsC [Chloroflexota bacterium]|nr:arsenate reductase ArsC [Chloroflexota bacterium]